MIYAYVREHPEYPIEDQKEAIKDYLAGKVLLFTEEINWVSDDCYGVIPFEDRPGGGMLANGLRQLKPADSTVGIHIVIPRICVAFRTMLEFHQYASAWSLRGFHLHVLGLGESNLRFSTDTKTGDMVMQLMEAIQQERTAIAKERGKYAKRNATKAPEPNYFKPSNRAEVLKIDQMVEWYRETGSYSEVWRRVVDCKWRRVPNPRNKSGRWKLHTVRRAIIWRQNNPEV